jgi:hypothetical protein
VSGLTVTLSWEHEDAIRYGARTMLPTETWYSEVRAFIEALQIVGTNERVELPLAWLDTFLIVFTRAAYISGLTGKAKQRLYRQTRKIRVATEASAVDRLGSVGG